MRHEPFVHQLADLCRAEPTRAKWVFVPTHAVGLTLGDRLASDGSDWANLRLVTPLDLAIRIAAPFLLERGLDPSEDALGPALVMRLLLDLPEKGGYFRPMAAHPSTAQALWRTIRELRFAGLRANDLQERHFSSRRKYQELRALLEAYEQHLQRHGAADVPAVYEEALRHPDWCPIAPTDVVIELPHTAWPLVVRRLLDALPGRRLAARSLLLPGAVQSARARQLTRPLEPVDVPPTSDASRLRFLQAPGAAGTALDDGTLTVFHAGGRDAEIDEVFRRILASGWPLDEVEIAFASEAYAPLAREKACRLEWPVTLSTGIAGAVTRPGRLLLRFCEWLASDVAASGLRRLLQAGDCAPHAFEEKASGALGHLSPGQAARLLLKAQATWGRHTYAASLARLALEYERRSKDPDAADEDKAWHARKAAQTRTLAGWIAGVLAAIPAPDAAAEVSLHALVEGAVAFLEANAARAGAADALALAGLTDALRDLKVLGDYRCSLDAAVSLLATCVDALAVERARPRPGHLHVSTLAEAGFDGRPHVFIVGVQEGAMFPAAVEDPVLLDEERVRIHPLLRTSTDRLDEALAAALARLAAIGQSSASVCLSFSCRDTREFRETFPSWLLLQAFRLQRGDASLSYEDLAHSLAEPACAVPASAAAATTPAGWWLATCETREAARPEILRAFPSLASGLRAGQARDSDVYTAFDGHVAVAGPLLDPSRTGRLVSATSLEDAATCPYRFFLRHGLGVRPIEEADAETDVWLTPLVRGSELHALFARILRAVRYERRAVDPKRDLRRLHDWADARLAELRAEMPPPSREVYDRERGDFMDDLEAFLASECEGRHGTHPVGIEVSFGFPRDEDGGEPLATVEPLVLDLGDGRRLRVHGRIDRINRFAPGRYEVVDYKTGGYWAANWEGVFAGGTRLQHAVYGRAAEALLAAHGTKAHVVRGTYAFPSVKGHRRLKVIDAPSADTLTAVLRHLMDVIGEGAFVVSEGTQGCRFCEFADACHADDPTAPRGDAATRAKKKVANLANTVLNPFRELRSHA